MDILSVAGLLIAIVSIIGGQYLEGGHLSSLFNIPAFIIVMGGTIGATLLETPGQIFVRALSRFHWIFFPPKFPFVEGIEKLVGWSHIARHSGLLGLDRYVNEESDPFLRRCLQFVVDGIDPQEIGSILEMEVELIEAREYLAAEVFESMGGYAPTIGILGAVIGLIHVMGSLSEPDKLGTGIAVAFVATIYGVGFANLVFIPVSKKIRKTVEGQTSYRLMMVKGILSIIGGQNPRMIESRLMSYSDGH